MALLLRVEPWTDSLGRRCVPVAPYKARMLTAYTSMIDRSIVVVVGVRAMIYERNSSTKYQIDEATLRVHNPPFPGCIVEFSDTELARIGRAKERAERGFNHAREKGRAIFEIGARQRAKRTGEKSVLPE